MASHTDNTIPRRSHSAGQTLCLQVHKAYEDRTALRQFELSPLILSSFCLVCHFPAIPSPLMTVNWIIYAIHSLEAQTIQVGAWKNAAGWLIKKENPIYASTFQIQRLIRHARFNNKFPNLTWGSEYCWASESKSLNPCVSVRSRACRCVPVQSRLQHRVSQMLKLNEDVLSHFRLFLSSSAQITLSQARITLSPLLPPSSTFSAMSNSFSSSSQRRLCLARLTSIRQCHFPARG